MRLPLLTLFLLLSAGARCQLWDDFADSNYTSNPAWTSSPGAWIINAGRQLQSVSTAVNGGFWISTPYTASGALQWDIRLRLAFSTSSVNYADVWLTSSTPDPTATAASGYFVRVGGTQDDICLYRKDGAAIVKLIDGADGVTDAADNRLRIQVLRTAAGLFYLRRGPETGALLTEGTAADNRYVPGGHFALLVRQSTASFFGKHYFDDISIRDWIPDTTAPALVLAEAESDTTLLLSFAEPVNTADASDPAHYLVSHGVGAPVAASPDPTDGSRLRLRFTNRFPSGVTSLVSVFNIRDEWGNLLVQDTESFAWYRPQRYDVLISEVMADPDPPVGLPSAEYLELYNRSRFPINLKGWRIATESTLSAPLPDLRLPPDSFVVLTSTAHFASLASFGRCIGLPGFPALDNDGAELRLFDESGSVQHAVAYQRSWYRNAVKDDGGWSLELGDSSAPCAGAAAWGVSADPSGGTPGRKNSFHTVPVLPETPRLLRCWTTDSIRVNAVFSAPLDSLSAVTARYRIDDGPTVLEASPRPPFFNTVEMRLSGALQRGRIYRLHAEGARGCSGSNEIDDGGGVSLGLPAAPAPGDIVINELLYSPHTGGAEYIELFVRGGAVLDLSKLLIGTLDAAGTMATPKRLSNTAYALFPGDYLAFSTDTADVLRSFFVKYPDRLLPCPGMPALPDGGTTLLLLNEQGVVLEECRYDPDWHFPLIIDAHGVALERLDPSGPPSDGHNWHSAASTAGYGTPTARNSQYLGASGDGLLEIYPAIFSPDGDGFDDIAAVQYAVEESGYMGTVVIYDALGRRVRNLVQAAVMGRTGRWTWDGLGDGGRALPAGVYVIYAELINPSGKRKAYKRTVTLARRLQ